MNKLAIFPTSNKSVTPLVPHGRGRPKGTLKRGRSSDTNTARQRLIVEAIRSLDFSVRKNFTKALARPKVAILEKITSLTDIAHWEIDEALPVLDGSRDKSVFFDPPDLSLRGGSWHIEYDKEGGVVFQNLFTRDLDAARCRRDEIDACGSVIMSDPQ